MAGFVHGIRIVEAGVTTPGLGLRRAATSPIRAGVSTSPVTENSKPFSKDGFSNKIRDRWDQAGMPQCAAHGLRKALARRMVKSKATQPGMKVVGG